MKSYLWLALALAIIGGFVAGVLGSLVAVPRTSAPVGDDAGARARERGEPLSTIELVDMVSPAVVSIVIEHEASAVVSPSPFFDDFFGFELPDSRDGVVRRVGAGSGFVVSSDGLILTNRHVVALSDARYYVVFNDGTEYEATVVARDPLYDVAILDTDVADAPFVELGDSDGLKIGETVVAIGNALGEYQNTVTKGIVSGINRRIVAGNGSSSEIIDSAIQTDAAINSGNSGGPLLDEYGRVIGINTAVSRQGQSIGFAIPINAARLALESYRAHGRIVRPWLGVRYVMVDADSADEEGLSIDYGALIVRGTSANPGVIPGSPADKAGLREGDVIIGIDGEDVDVRRSLSAIISSYAVGDSLEIVVWRDGAEVVVHATLDELDIDEVS